MFRTRPVETVAAQLCLWGRGGSRNLSIFAWGAFFTFTFCTVAQAEPVTRQDAHDTLQEKATPTLWLGLALFPQARGA